MAVDIKDIEQVANELKGNFDEFRQKMISALRPSSRKRASCLKPLRRLTAN